MRKNLAGVKATEICSIARKNRLTPTTTTCNWDCHLTVKRAEEQAWLTKKTKSFSLKITWFKPLVGRPTSEQMTRAFPALEKYNSSSLTLEEVQPSKSTIEKKVSRKKLVFQESSQSLLRIRLRFKQTKISCLRTRKMFSWLCSIATVKPRTTRRWLRISKAILMMKCALLKMKMRRWVSLQQLWASFSKVLTIAKISKRT